MSVKGRPEVGRVCDDDGQVIREEGEVRKRWRELLRHATTEQ